MSRLSNTTIIIVAGSIVLTLSFGIRSVFGIMLDPISETYGGPREIYSLSMAISMIVSSRVHPARGRWAVASMVGLPGQVPGSASVC